MICRQATRRVPRSVSKERVSHMRSDQADTETCSGIDAASALIVLILVVVAVTLAEVVVERLIVMPSVVISKLSISLRLF